MKQVNPGGARPEVRWCTRRRRGRRPGWSEVGWWCARRRRRQRRGPEQWIEECLPPLAKSDDECAADKMQRHSGFPALAINRKSADEPEDNRGQNRPRQPIANARADCHGPGATRIRRQFCAEDERDHAPSQKGPEPALQPGSKTMQESARPASDCGTPGRKLAGAVPVAGAGSRFTGDRRLR